MKLLLDQNISYRLIASLADVYPDSSHVRFLGLEHADDETVWRFALEHGFTLVSKDSDFHQRSFLRGFPPKVVWLRLGNCSTNDIERMLRSRSEGILRFCEDQTHAFLILT